MAKKPEYWSGEVTKEIKKKQKGKKPAEPIEKMKDQVAEFEKRAKVVKAVREVVSYSPPAGMFADWGMESIAEQLKKDSESLKQAMARLNFYINRAGENLSKARKKVLEGAKDKLRSIFKKKKT